MGSRNDAAAWKWLKKDDLMQYFGKPLDELQYDLKVRHLAAMSRLRDKKQEQK
jgi:hypothetical protein